MIDRGPSDKSDKSTMFLVTVVGQFVNVPGTGLSGKSSMFLVQFTSIPIAEKGNFNFYPRVISKLKLDKLFMRHRGWLTSPRCRRNN